MQSKLSRGHARRAVLLNQLFKNVLTNGHIVTSLARGKALRCFFDRKFTLMSRGRVALGVKLPRYLWQALRGYVSQEQERSGGYLSFKRLGTRDSDSAPMVRLALLAPRISLG